MALPGNKKFSDYDNYITDQNPTTSAQAQDYFRNQAELLKAVIDCDFWQPETVYQPGDVVKSDSMPNGAEAVMVATKASVTSNVEPQWGAVGGANISDGACFWKLRWQHWSKENATNRLPNTSYAVGNVVYDKSNLSVALKCTTAGTTSSSELDISTKAVGDTVTDGSVVWEVVSRDAVAIINQERPIKTFTSLAQLGLDNNVSEVDIVNALPNNSIFQDYIGAAGSMPNFTLKEDGVLVVKKTTINQVILSFICGAGLGFSIWEAKYVNWFSPSFSGWKKVATNGALSMPSGKSIAISLSAVDGGAQVEARYNAPADGYVSIASNMNYNTYAYITNYSTAITMSSAAYNSAVFMPVKKGDNLIMAVNLSGHTGTPTAKFIYAQSEV